MDTNRPDFRRKIRAIDMIEGCISYRSTVSDRQFAKHIHQFTVNRLVVLDSLGERYINDFIILNTNHYVTLSFHQSLNTGYTHTAGDDIPSEPEYWLHPYGWR